jgi:hypothetical protein
MTFSAVVVTAVDVAMDIVLVVDNHLKQCSCLTNSLKSLSSLWAAAPVVVSINGLVENHSIGEWVNTLSLFLDLSIRASLAGNRSRE